MKFCFVYTVHCYKVNQRSFSLKIKVTMIYSKATHCFGKAVIKTFYHYDLTKLKILLGVFYEKLIANTCIYMNL